MTWKGRIWLIPQSLVFDKLPTYDVRQTMPQDTFYSSKLWRDTRATQLRRQPYCCVCALINMRTRATEVDHIRAIRAGGHPTNPANLRSLCGTHHSQKTIMIDGMHRNSGKKLVTTGPDGFPVHVEQQRKT